MKKAFRAIVSGRVQMVMYRDFAQRKACGFGVVGTVKNLSNGTVEVIAEGDETALSAYIEKLKRGSMLSRVENVSIERMVPTGRFANFSIIYE